MHELRISVCYPMPLDLERDERIKAYAQQYGFECLGSGSDGVTRDIGFKGSTDEISGVALLWALSHLLREGEIVSFQADKTDQKGMILDTTIERFETDRTKTLMSIMGQHAVAISIASNHLAKASSHVKQEEWLQVIMAQAKTEYETCHPDQFKHYLAQTIQALGVSTIEL